VATDIVADSSVSARYFDLHRWPPTPSEFVPRERREPATLRPAPKPRKV
jgi:hypothetical protein